MRRRLGNARAFALAGPLLLAMPAFSLVDSLLFQPTRGVDLTLERLGVRGEEVFLETEDGVRIHGFLLPPRAGVREAASAAPASAPRAILFLHGNAGNASHRLPNAVDLASLDATVLLLDYRGYGRSEGRPTEHGVYADARAGLAHLADLGFPEERVVLFGRSLGGAVAVELARGRPLGGVILESTFPSLAEVARTHFGPLGSWVARGRFDVRAGIVEVRAPLLFFHGDRDEVVPFALGRSLFEAAPEPKAFETLAGAGHNDTVMVGGLPYLRRIGAFLDEVAPR